MSKGRKKKYDGGSREISFRLPVKYFEEAKKAINIVLGSFMNKKVNDPVKANLLDEVGHFVKPKDWISDGVFSDPIFLDKAKKLVVIDEKVKRVEKKVISPQLKEKLLKLDPNIVVPEVKIVDGIIYYPCKCIDRGEDSRFERHINCRIGYRKQHMDEYS